MRGARGLEESSQQGAAPGSGPGGRGRRGSVLPGPLGPFPPGTVLKSALGTAAPTRVAPA
jgi:hypothetical protein